MRSLKPFPMVTEQKLRRGSGHRDSGRGGRIVLAALLATLLATLLSVTGITAETAATASPPADDARQAEHFYYSGSLDQHAGDGLTKGSNTTTLDDLPDLTPYLLAGWDDKIVPRNSNDATGGSCTLPDSLYGNLNSTYLNWAEINASSVECPAHHDRAYLDDAYAAWASFGVLLPNQAGAAINIGTLQVRGGLHALSDTLDWDELVAEANEANNSYAAQFAWTPYILANKTPLYRGVPPNKGSFAYPNSDGFEFTYGAICAVGMTPVDASDDYDVRIHDGYVNPTTSFRSYGDWSSAVAGYTDFIIANAWGGSSGKEDIGVYRYSDTGPGSGMYVEMSNYYGLIGATGYYSQTIPDYNIIDLFGVYLSESGNYTFEVENQSGMADLDFAIYPDGGDYYDRFEYLKHSNMTGDGGDEMFTEDIVAGDIYPLAVFKSRSTDLGKAVTYRIHVYKTPPNLQPYVPSGWNFPVVPRDKDGATSSSATLTDSLPGDSAGTYINLSWWNEGPDTAGMHTTYIYKDTLPFVGGTVTHINPAQWVYGVNWGPYYVENGRHTLQEVVDYADDVVETDEDDNMWEMQFAWTPHVLENDIPEYWTQPPPPGVQTYVNCDGYQLNGGWWNAIGIMPVEYADDYDIHLHPPYSSSLDGYTDIYDISCSVAGSSDFVLFNGNNAAVGYGATMDAGVYIEDAGAHGDYYVEGEATSLTYGMPVAIYSKSLDAYEILDVYEVQFTETGNYTVELEPTSGDADAGICMYDYLTAYLHKCETLPGAWADSYGAGHPETFTVQIDTAGYYGLVVWKAHSWDLAENVVYNINISETPPNLTYSLPAGWSYPFTPRSTADAATYYAPLSSQLWGDSVATYINVSWANVGPDTAGPHETHCYRDGRNLASFRRVAPLAPAGSLFVINVGPVNIPGGRHTLSDSIDVLDEVMESDESDNVSSGQFVWAPRELALGSPELRQTPPERGAGTYPNCDGYYVPHTSNWTYVTAMCPVGDEDYDLLLYTDYASSESGFSDIVASSMMGSGQTEFVGSRYTEVATYPAAVQPLPSKGNLVGGAAPGAPLASAVWMHAVSSEGWVYFLADLPVEIDDEFYAYEIASVYDVQLDVGDYDFHLVNSTLGMADLALAIMPISAGVYGRADAEVEVNSGGPTEDEFVTFTSAEAGWYEVVVFKPGYVDMPRGAIFSLRVGEAGVAGAWDGEPLIPGDFTIEQNRPNPFKGFTTIRFGVPNPGAHVKLSVYDAAGRHVATLFDGRRQPGYHEVTWDGTGASGRSAASGIYFCRFEAGGRTMTGQMLLLK